MVLHTATEPRVPMMPRWPKARRFDCEENAWFAIFRASRDNPETKCRVQGQTPTAACRFRPTFAAQEFVNICPEIHPGCRG